jgi:predicted TIM-barrel fold metal-dependent hydrolase
VLFGTDYPYPAEEITIGARRRLETTEVLTDRERETILGGSAVRLIPRLLARATAA